MREDVFRRATLPLFEAGEVEVLEWSFELGWAGGEPPWVTLLLDHYADAGRLFGHGVTYSPLSVDAARRHATWLDRVAEDCRRRRYAGVSEHFGFMGNDALDIGAPLPMPNLPETVEVGRAALGRLAAVCGTAVGLENLALAFGEPDVWAQGELLAAMLEPWDGYLVLDVHNLYCQVASYRVDPVALLETYPLSRVRYIHVSGGSWTGDFRRDTHDADVPSGAFEILDLALARCPDAEAVILERLGPTLRGAGAGERFRRDFHAIKERVG
jgi:hypothetical protein